MDQLNAQTRHKPEALHYETCSPADFNETDWPVQPGDYLVFRPKEATGIILLAETPDLQPQHFSDLQEIALAGILHTENIGIEHLIKNVIANPFLRHLVLLGPDIPGHLPGNALIALSADGVDEQSGRINGAHGARPVLKNILPIEIEHFRKQITLHALMHIHSDAAAHIKQLNLSAAPFQNNLVTRSTPITRAEPAACLRLDRAGYFIILLRRAHEYPLYIEHYQNDGRLAHIFEGTDPASLCHSVIEKGLVSQLDHAAYLGRELTRAQMALISGEKYIQDRAQGEPGCS